MNAKHLDIQGCRRLVAAIIEQAVVDLRGLEDSGVLIVQDGFLAFNPKNRGTRFKSVGHNTAADVIQLLHFFGSPLDEALSTAGLEISANSVREKLKIKPL